MISGTSLGRSTLMALASHATTNVLWYIQPVLQSAVAVVLWRRKLHKHFPVFFAFLVFQVVNFAVVYPCYQYSYELYFWAFWTGEALNAVLGFKVIHEIFLDVFRPYHSLKDLGTPVFKWAGVVMLLVSVVVAVSNSSEQNPMIHSVTTLQRSVRLVQFGLVLFLVVFSRFLGVSRKQVSFGIALGFGLMAGVELMLLAMHSGGLVGRSNLDLIDIFACDLSIVAWLAYSFSPTVAREAQVNHLQTQRWEQGLADLHQPSPNDSLIPMFETMVERAFNRNSNPESLEDLPFPKHPESMPRSKSAAAGSKARS